MLRRRNCGFTLVEIMVAIAVLMLLMTLLLAITNQTSATWRYTTGRIEQFSEAREGFESITRRLSQATLNTYWDYDNPTTPSKYIRQSELRFISGPIEIAGDPPASREWLTHGIFFQAPLGISSDPTAKGLENLLNTWGYFVEFGDDTATRPDFITDQVSKPRSRFRLKELMQPSDDFSIYHHTSGLDQNGVPRNLGYSGKQWFQDALSATNPPVHVLAENVVALVLLPKLPAKDLAKVGIVDPAKQSAALAATYVYDSSDNGAARDYPADASKASMLNSKNQLPPLVQVTIVAIDEASAVRFIDGNKAPNLGLENLFKKAEDYDQDIATLQKTLLKQKFASRTFTTNVNIKGARWSSEQTN